MKGMDAYDYVDLIGEGATSSVHLMERKTDRVKFAMKMMNERVDPNNDS